MAEKNILQKSLVKRLVHEHLAPYKAKFVQATFFMLMTAASTAALPFLLQPVFDDVFTTNDPHLLFVFCLAVLSAFVIKGFASYGETVTMTRIGQSIISDIQNRVFSHLMNLDLEYFHKTNSGELLSRFTNDISLMRNSVANTVVGIGRDCFSLIFLIGVMFYRDWFLACLAFFIFPAAFLPIIRIGRRMRKVTFNAQEEIARFTKQLTQIFQGIRVIKAYSTENYEANRAQNQIEKIYKLVVKTSKVRSLGHPIIESMGGIAIISVIAYGGWQVMHHSRTTGEFISFIGALILAYEPLKRLSNLNATLQEGLAAASRVFEIVDTKGKIVSPKNAKQPKKTQGHIEFKNVYFAYGAQKEALKGISFQAASGKCIALVGASGSGKSTIINLIPRFYDVDQGTIQIDGVSVKDWKIEHLREQIALVSQEIALFDLSVFENITYGCQNFSEHDVYSVAKSAAAHDFIQKLPQGYNTIVGENGVSLSGGQRQRLAIARAMLKKSPILLLDEATSALDTHSERHIQSALKKLMIGRTTIMVAHRLSTVIDADYIYVLENGQIIEEGSHQELLQLGKQYAHLWNKQAQGLDSEN
ncbi:MAG: ABC transporter ATP-binding protein [Pseudomonadota bacterium]|jgi:subfamily B ATP-binding cassette protein MsbA|nr:ABC transporter ATP-binding protein/permease [Alphaproteobacteria bacterium]